MTFSAETFAAARTPRREGTGGMSPALAASLLLHLSAVGALLLSFHGSVPDVEVGGPQVIEVALLGGPSPLTAGDGGDVGRKSPLPEDGTKAEETSDTRQTAGSSQAADSDSEGSDIPSNDEPVDRDPPRAAATDDAPSTPPLPSVKPAPVSFYRPVPDIRPQQNLPDRPGATAAKSPDPAPATAESTRGVAKATQSPTGRSPGTSEPLSIEAGDERAALNPGLPGAGGEGLSPVAGNPAPAYPERARRRGWEGRVILEVEVTSDGAVAEVRIAESSGYGALDSAALEAVRRWRFEGDDRTSPGGAANVRVPIRFRIEDQ